MRPKPERNNRPTVFEVGFCLPSPVYADIQNRLDLVIKHLDSFKDNAVTPLAIEPVIKRLEKNIVSRYTTLAFIESSFY